MRLPLKKIRLDGGTQTRARIREDIIEEYAEDMKSGAPFPPLIVFHDGKDYWLADGFHRWGAAMQLHLDSIECEIRQGTLADAQWYSFSANKANGMRRTNDDKVRAVNAALRHCKGERSNVEIARHVGVDDHTVAKYRQELASAGEIPDGASPRSASSELPKMPNNGIPGETARVVTRKGRSYTMRTANIGRAMKPRRENSQSISLPTDNPRVAAGNMLSRYERTFLAALVRELDALLKEQAES